MTLLSSRNPERVVLNAGQPLKADTIQGNITGRPGALLWSLVGPTGEILTDGAAVERVQMAAFDYSSLRGAVQVGDELQGRFGISTDIGGMAVADLDLWIENDNAGTFDRHALLQQLRYLGIGIGRAEFSVLQSAIEGDGPFAIDGNVLYIVDESTKQVADDLPDEADNLEVSKFIDIGDNYFQADANGKPITVIPGGPGFPDRINDATAGVKAYTATRVYTDAEKPFPADAVAFPPAVRGFAQSANGDFTSYHYIGIGGIGWEVRQSGRRDVSWNRFTRPGFDPIGFGSRNTLDNQRIEYGAVVVDEIVKESNKPVNGTVKVKAYKWNKNDLETSPGRVERLANLDFEIQYSEGAPAPFDVKTINGTRFVVQLQTASKDATGRILSKQFGTSKRSRVKVINLVVNGDIKARDITNLPGIEPGFSVNGKAYQGTPFYSVVGGAETDTNKVKHRLPKTTKERTYDVNGFHGDDTVRRVRFIVERPYNMAYGKTNLFVKIDATEPNKPQVIIQTREGVIGNVRENAPLHVSFTTFDFNGKHLRLPRFLSLGHTPTPQRGSTFALGTGADKIDTRKVVDAAFVRRITEEEAFVIEQQQQVNVAPLSPALARRKRILTALDEDLLSGNTITTRETFIEVELQNMDANFALFKDWFFELRGQTYTMRDMELREDGICIATFKVES